MTETGKWQGWFRKLPPNLKLLWNYITDICDNAGVWKVDKDLAELCIGGKRKVKINWEEAIKLFDKRIYIFDSNEKWYITGFIEFQIGSEYLSSNSPPHKKILDLLKHHKLLNSIIGIDNKILTYPKGRVNGICNTPKEKERDIEEEKDPLKEGIVKGGNENYIAEILPELKTVKINKEEYDKLVLKFGIDGAKYRIEDVFYHIGKFGDKYKSHYLTILSWERKSEREKNKKEKPKIKGLDALKEFGKDDNIK